MHVHLVLGGVAALVRVELLDAIIIRIGSTSHRCISSHFTEGGGEKGLRSDLLSQK